MKTRALIILFFCAIAAALPAQQAGMSQRQVDAIKSALQRIAISNNVVPNIIYDGMTYNEVLAVLDVPFLTIEYRVPSDPRSSGLEFFSVVGRYCLFWSGGFPRGNPVVVGYSPVGDRTILHNQLP